MYPVSSKGYHINGIGTIVKYQITPKTNVLTYNWADSNYHNIPFMIFTNLDM